MGEVVPVRQAAAVALEQALGLEDALKKGVALLLSEEEDVPLAVWLPQIVLLCDAVPQAEAAGDGDGVVVVDKHNVGEPVVDELGAAVAEAVPTDVAVTDTEGVGLTVRSAVPLLLNELVVVGHDLPVADGQCEGEPLREPVCDGLTEPEPLALEVIVALGLPLGEYVLTLLALDAIVTVTETHAVVETLALELRVSAMLPLRLAEPVTVTEAQKETVADGQRVAVPVLEAAELTDADPE